VSTEIFSSLGSSRVVSLRCTTDKSPKAKHQTTANDEQDATDCSYSTHAVSQGNGPHWIEQNLGNDVAKSKSLLQQSRFTHFSLFNWRQNRTTTMMVRTLVPFLVFAASACGTSGQIDRSRCIEPTRTEKCAKLMLAVPSGLGVG